MIEIWYKRPDTSFPYQIWMKDYLKLMPFRFRKIEKSIKHIEQYYKLTLEDEKTLQGVLLTDEKYEMYFKLFDTKSKKFLKIYSLSPWYVGLKNDSSIVERWNT